MNRHRCGCKPHLPFSRLVGTVSNCADTVRLETAPTPIHRDRNRPAPIISLQVPIYRDARRVGIYPEYRGFIGGIETEGRKRLFILAHIKS